MMSADKKTADAFQRRRLFVFGQVCDQTQAQPQNDAVRETKLGHRVNNSLERRDN